MGALLPRVGALQRRPNQPTRRLARVRTDVTRVFRLLGAAHKQADFYGMAARPHAPLQRVYSRKDARTVRGARQAVRDAWSKPIPARTFPTDVLRPLLPTVSQRALFSGV